MLASIQGSISADLVIAGIPEESAAQLSGTGCVSGMAVRSRNPRLGKEEVSRARCACVVKEVGISWIKHRKMTA